MLATDQIQVVQPLFSAKKKAYPMMNLLLTQQKRHFFLSLSLTFAVTAMGCVDGDIQNKAQV